MRSMYWRWQKLTTGVDVSEWLMWQFRSVFTQTSAGGGAFALQIKPGISTRMVLYYLIIGPDDYAGDETFSVTVEDQDDNTVGVIIRDMAADNERITIPNLPATGDADTGMNVLPGQLPVIGDDYLEVSSSAIANTKTVTISFRIAYWGNKPEIVSSNGGGTWTEANSQDKVR